MSWLLDFTSAISFLFVGKREKIYLKRKDTKFPILNNGLRL